MIRDYSHIAIKLTGVSKRYTIHHEKPTLVEKFVNGRDETFWALKDVNLTIRKGERVGIIGPNGSGKTTLLKVIAGITTQTAGTVETHGKVVSLIDLMAGFHPDISGEQNIYLNGMLLGMKREEIARKLKRIIAFADIGRFIDAPLFTYSAGMKLRLGFAVAVHADPDIIILDEGMAVGDASFQKKSAKKLRQFFQNNCAVIMVSHNTKILQPLCARIVVIQNGGVHGDGGRELLTDI